MHDDDRGRAIRELTAAFTRLGRSMDAMEKRIASLEQIAVGVAEAVTDLTGSLSLFARLMAEASENPKPLETLMGLFRQILKR